MKTSRTVTAVRQSRRRILTSPLLNLTLLVFGFLVCVALVVDLTYHPSRPEANFPDVVTELQTMVLGLDGPRYVDRSGLFSIVKPAGWRYDTFPDCKPYNVEFFSPNGARIGIMAVPIKYNDLPSLFADIESRESEYDIRTDLEAFRFQGRPAVKRHCTLSRIRVVAVDFVDSYVAHHILCSVPVEVFDKYEPVLMDLINTYQATNIITAATNSSTATK